MRFATELLIQHKAAVDQQAVNAIVASGTADESMPGCSNVVNLSIWDEATNTLHAIEVTPAQYDRAIIGYYKLLLSLERLIIHLYVCVFFKLFFF